eukprot:scaffold2957_cov226-Isochrysis_galbana.AAC.5
MYSPTSPPSPPTHSVTSHFRAVGQPCLCTAVQACSPFPPLSARCPPRLPSPPSAQLAPTTGGFSNADLEALLWPEAPAHKVPAPPQDDSQRAAAAPPPGKAPAPAARDVASVLALGKGKQGGLPLAAIAAIAIAVAAVAAASLFTILGTAGGGDLAASVNVGEARGLADEMGAGEGV